MKYHDGEMPQRFVQACTRNMTYSSKFITSFWLCYIFPCLKTYTCHTYMAKCRSLIQLTLIDPHLAWLPRYDTKPQIPFINDQAIKLQSSPPFFVVVLSLGIFHLGAGRRGGAIKLILCLFSNRDDALMAICCKQEVNSRDIPIQKGETLADEGST